MDAKKKISGYVGGKIWMPIAGAAMFVVGIPTITVGIGALLLTVGFFFLLIGLCVDVPANNRAKKNLANLELNGQLEKAAAELDSPNKKVIGKNKAILTENFLFCKGNGIVLPISDVAWVYKHRLTQRLLFIPIRSIDSLMLGDGKKAPVQAINLGGKDKNDELKNVMLEMYQKNPNMMIGYSAENQKAYKALHR